MFDKLKSEFISLNPTKKHTRIDEQESKQANYFFRVIRSISFGSSLARAACRNRNRWCWRPVSFVVVSLNKDKKWKRKTIKWTKNERWTWTASISSANQSTSHPFPSPAPNEETMPSKQWQRRQWWPSQERNDWLIPWSFEWKSLCERESWNEDAEDDAAAAADKEETTTLDGSAETVSREGSEEETTARLDSDDEKKAEEGGGRANAESDSDDENKDEPDEPDEVEEGREKRACWRWKAEQELAREGKGRRDVTCIAAIPHPPIAAHHPVSVERSGDGKMSRAFVEWHPIEILCLGEIAWSMDLLMWKATKKGIRIDAILNTKREGENGKRHTWTNLAS